MSVFGKELAAAPGAETDAGEVKAVMLPALGEEEITLLAYLIVHQAPLQQICRNMMLSEDVVRALEETEEVKQMIQALEVDLSGRAKIADDFYDQAEMAAMGQVNEQLAAGQIIDTRTLLQVAAMANKATRRSPRLRGGQGTSGTQGGTQGGTSDTTIRKTATVRLRSRFLQKLQTKRGDQMIAREEEIIVEGQLPENRIDHMGSEALKRHVEDSLGTSIDNAQKRQEFGFTDFGNFDLGDTE